MREISKMSDEEFVDHACDRASFSNDSKVRASALKFLQTLKEGGLDDESARTALVQFIQKELEQ